MKKQMWWGQVICPRSSEWQGLDSCWLCLTQEPELLTMHCSVSRCPARPHNTPRRRLNMKQRLAAFQSVNTFITRCTKKAGRLESLYWTQQFRPVQALTSNSIWRFSISILKTWLTSQLLYLMEPFVDGVKKGSKRIYLFSFFSFHWKKIFNHNGSGVISYRQNCGAVYWIREVLGLWAQMALIIWAAIDRCDSLGFCSLGQV